MFSRRAWISAALATMAACLGNPSPPSVATAPVERRQENLITADELSNPAIAGQNLLDAVRKLRPNFLTSRGPVSIRNSAAGKVHVSIDGGALADIGTMSSYMPSAVAEVRYLTATEAAQKFGSAANSGGVIIVKSK